MEIPNFSAGCAVPTAEVTFDRQQLSRNLKKRQRNERSAGRVHFFPPLLLAQQHVQCAAKPLNEALTQACYMDDKCYRCATTNRLLCCKTQRRFAYKAGCKERTRPAAPHTRSPSPILSHRQAQVLVLSKPRTETW